MLFTTHLAAGLIIGKLTGDYRVSLISSVIIDLDHLVVYYRNGVLFKFKKWLRAACNKSEIEMYQKNILHNIFFGVAASVILSAVNFKIGLVFCLAYLSHLLLDSLDNLNYFPFYPSKKINLHGPVKYFSRQEVIFALILLLIFFII